MINGIVLTTVKLLDPTYRQVLTTQIKSWFGEVDKNKQITS